MYPSGSNSGLAEGTITRLVTFPDATRGFQLQEGTMNMYVSIGPLVALIAGILILVVPRLLNYIVAVYLIIIGLLGLFGSKL